MAKKNKGEAVETNLELDKRLTGGNSANQGDATPKSKAEQANLAIQEEFYEDREEGPAMRTNIYQQPKD
ncbi:hypothetical protein AM500_01555 [Bacillus sp. FJAT-18017]|uniref:hypothetical protein n=1 Tax=Bacillus sp. FJAT-18017 TaxID=1705566 RepID=UPI0006AD9A39|nr:hypothetical protein [Bacillus sp. FJAT-18017]ALC88625.1 hypothetical protein AM500_01555 [Bacillus sp. FJAT-18017]